MRLAMFAAALLLAAPAAAAPQTFDWERARAFCASVEKAEAEDCLAQQEKAWRRVDEWLDSGRFNRLESRHAYAHCEAKTSPDFLATWLCLDDLRDDSRRSFRRR